MLVGLTLRTPPEAIYRAIIESIAFGTRRIVEEFSSVGLAPRRIIISGGIAKKNAFIMQTVADILHHIFTVVKFKILRQSSAAQTARPGDFRVAVRKFFSGYDFQQS